MDNQLTWGLLWNTLSNRTVSVQNVNDIFMIYSYQTCSVILRDSIRFQWVEFLRGSDKLENALVTRTVSRDIALFLTE